MHWNLLESELHLQELIEKSYDQPSAIFKHSTRCSISVMVKNRLDRTAIATNIAFYYMDLLRFRELSNKIAEKFQVYHESPQLLLIHKGECIYEESHNGIDMDELIQAIPTS
jgi:bacillithiol system protein YtxJ